jgi:hypothetical protein
MDHSSVTQYLIEYYEVISLNPVGPFLLYFKYNNESAIYINYTFFFFFFFFLFFFYFLIFFIYFLISKEIKKKGLFFLFKKIEL